ncbi:MAG TPA: phosphoribosyltransferase family protein [Sphingobacteriaceae bacterium]|nr:phosphoribosyltransferase family protein [Sphingobacteriaceae bacterium]
MESNKLSILDSKGIAEKTTRIAYQILEDNFEEKTLVFAGIADRGFIFAQRLKEEFELISSAKVDLIKLTIDKDSTSLRGSSDVDVEIARNKVLVIIDDVLNSGRTLAYGLGLFLNVPLKKMRVVVLIDRNHRKFPIVSDFAGLELSTVLKEHVSVNFNNDNKEEDAAYLL